MQHDSMSVDLTPAKLSNHKKHHLNSTSHTASEVQRSSFLLLLSPEMTNPSSCSTACSHAWSASCNDRSTISRLCLLRYRCCSLHKLSVSQQEFSGSGLGSGVLPDHLTHIQTRPRMQSSPTLPLGALRMAKGVTSSALTVSLLRARAPSHHQVCPLVSTPHMRRAWGLCGLRLLSRLSAPQPLGWRTG